MGGIANGGVMMTPHFYKSSKGDEKDWGEGERAISEDAASQVTSCMQTVVFGGNGRLAARLTAIDVAGKTGTAERADENGGYLKENYMSSFMGFAPAQSPKVLCYITLDERRAAQMRCGAVPVHYCQRARRAGYPTHEVGGYNLWGVVCCPI